MLKLSVQITVTPSDYLLLHHHQPNGVGSRSLTCFPLFFQNYLSLLCPSTSITDPLVVLTPLTYSVLVLHLWYNKLFLCMMYVTVRHLVLSFPLISPSPLPLPSQPGGGGSPPYQTSTSFLQVEMEFFLPVLLVCGSGSRLVVPREQS